MLKNGGKPRKCVLFIQRLDTKRMQRLVDQFNKSHTKSETEVVTDFGKLVEMVTDYKVKRMVVHEDDEAACGMILQICGILGTFECDVIKIECDMRICDWSKYDLCGMSGLMRLQMENSRSAAERDRLSCCIKILEM